MTFEEFEVAVERFRADAVAYSKPLVGDHAEDLVHATVLELVHNKNYTKFDKAGTAQFSTWFSKCVRNQCRQFLRKIKRREDLEACNGFNPKDIDPDEDLEDSMDDPDPIGDEPIDAISDELDNASQSDDIEELRTAPHNYETLHQTECDSDEQAPNSRKEAMRDYGEAAETSEVCICRKLGLKRAMLDLTLQQRKVIVLKYRFDHTQAETARYLGLTPRAAQICLEKARKILLENSEKHELREYL